MCCVDPKKYFGGYCNRIADSLKLGAALPYLDDASDSSVTPQVQPSSKDLFNLKPATQRIQ